MSSTSWITETPIAHRGYHDMNKLVWENTHSAFARAIKSGFPIECDLQLSSDDVAVVFHDYETLQLCGVDGTVRDMPAEQLTSLKVGSTTDGIPTFGQLLKQVDGKVGLVVELKPPHEDDVAAFAGAVLTDLKGYEGQVALMSFDAKLVEALIDSGENWPVGLVAAEFNEAAKRKNHEALSLPVNFVSFCVDHLPSDFVSKARAKGLLVITWTVRDEASRKSAADFADQITFEGFDPLALSA
ncbi:MAG: glycerophosphodiester phosphodiesterase [Hyphomicrobiales bacterium]|nr:glycerophosphodiester phosphodiesterase [Hyphomicrobiales bacterium]MCP4999618.1 glycerophosphodiester phosphodiesterase [Hyphomicrobiales bacterium]